MAKTKWRTQKARTLSLNRERFVSSKNREQFAILTKQKKANLLKVSVLFHKKRRTAFAFRGENSYTAPIFAERPATLASISRRDGDLVSYFLRRRNK